ncbi:MAG TPA: hypothetical protein VGG74_26905 [Kofleriaceae bacterium]
MFAALVASTACHHDHQGAAPATPLVEVAVAMPIAPGKTDAWQAALHEFMGARYDEYEASRRRYGLTSQTTVLQRTPMGDFALVHMTGADVRASFHAMSTSQDPWDVKWRELTSSLHGVDFAKDGRVAPDVVPVFETSPPAASVAPPFMLLAPLAPGAADSLRALGRELDGPRHADYLRARATIGVRREAAFLETTAVGDAIVIYWEADDPKASLDAFAASTDPFDVWLRGQMASLHPLALDQLAGIAKRNELVAQYPHAR